MDTLLIVARAALAGVFLVAAVAKLADMAGSRQALGGFGVPTRVVPFAALALPAAELIAAGLLVPAATAAIGAALAGILLLAFVAGIVAALRRGETPDCHCFGQLHSRPAGAETIVRNGVLIAIALLVLSAGPGPSPASWAAESDGQTIALAAVSLVAALLAYATVALWRENRRLTGHGHGADLPSRVEVGQQVPPFEIVDLTGATRTSDELVGHRRTVLVFTSATCGPCVGLLPQLVQWSAMLAGRLDIRVLASGDADANRRLADEHDMPMLLDRDAAAANAFGVVATPSAVEVDASGRIAGPAAAGAPAIEGLIRAALKRPAETTVVEVRHVGSTHGVRSGEVST